MTGQYHVILADPPWPFGVWNVLKADRHVSYRYPVMTMPDIAALPVRDLAARDAVLLLWVTMPNLPECIDVMRAWGFTYKTCAFTWIKTNRNNGQPFMGMGFYTRGNAELCLLGVRGKPLKRYSRAVEQVILAPKREHSRKPEQAYQRIETLFGDVRRVELFSRYPRPGWAQAMSNQSDKFRDLWSDCEAS